MADGEMMGNHFFFVFASEWILTFFFVLAAATAIRKSWQLKFRTLRINLQIFIFSIWQQFFLFCFDYSAPGETVQKGRVFLFRKSLTLGLATIFIITSHVFEQIGKIPKIYICHSSSNQTLIKITFVNRRAVHKDSEPFFDKIPILISILILCLLYYLVQVSNKHVIPSNLQNYASCHQPTNVQRQFLGLGQHDVQSCRPVTPPESWRRAAVHRMAVEERGSCTVHFKS
jgi:hypothetical protein